MRDVLKYTESILETVRELMIELDSELRVLRVSHNFYNTFNMLPEDTIGHSIYDLANRQWDVPKMRVLLEEILPHKTALLMPVYARLSTKNCRKYSKLNTEIIPTGA